jgi:hypothetical protein
MRLVDDEAYGDRVLGKLEHAADGLAEVADKLNAREGTLGKLINEPTLHDEARRLVHEVRTSWLVRLYQGLRGLWPASDAPAAGPEAAR